MMDIQYLRDYVRTYLDLAEEDLSDVLIDRWASEGVTKIQRATRRWPFYQAVGTVAATSGTQSYAKPLRHIEAIRDQWGRSLEYMDHSLAASRFGPEAVGPPLGYSIFADQITFWPTPDATYTLNVWGYRDGIALDGAAGTIPDMPEEFHEALLNWVMARAMEHQEDPEMSQLHETRFEKILATLTVEEMSSPTARPTIMGGGNGLAKRYGAAELDPPRLGAWGI